MGLIIKDKIAQLRKGYPTVSDKYNVQGGVVEGTAAISFGDLVAYGETTGHYKKFTSTDELGDLAGIAIATNVKLVPTWPAGDNTQGEFAVGEYMGLLIDGFIAVELDTTTTLASIVEGAAVKLEDGKLTVASSEEDVVLPRTIFTGVYEVKYASNGTTVVQILAEIRYNM